jgi:hypothetical protein
VCPQRAHASPPAPRSLGSDFSLLNAICEALDNAIRACIRRGADGAPREVHLSLVKRANGKWCLLVRDTGVGLDHTELPLWATLGVQEEAGRPAVDGEDPGAPNGDLHRYGVGGKCAALRICAALGRIVLVSRKLRPGCEADVSFLYLSKKACRDRQAAERAYAVARATRGEAAGPPPPGMFELPGGRRAPLAEERGEVEAAGGGHWHGSGTSVAVEDVDAELPERMTEAGMPALLSKLAATYHSYIHAREPAVRFMPPAAGEGGEPAAKRARKADPKGKAPAAEVAPQPPAARVPPPVRVFVGGRDLATVQDDVVSRMLAAGRTAPSERLELDLCVTFPAGPTGPQRSHARLSLYYFPFADGAASLPAELSALGMAPGSVLKRRAGRLLHLDGNPATLQIAQLLPKWGRDSPVLSGAASALGPRALARVAGFFDMGWTWAPLKDKSDLCRDTALAQVLTACFAVGAEGTAHVEAVVDVALRYTDAAGAWHAAGWQPFGDGRVVRKALLEWGTGCHARFDREAAPFAPPQSHPLLVGTISEVVREALGADAHEHVTAWHGMRVTLDAPAAGGASGSRAARLTELVAGGKLPLHVQLVPRAVASAHSGPGRPRAEPYTVAFFVTAAQTTMTPRRLARSPCWTTGPRPKRAAPRCSRFPARSRGASRSCATRRWRSRMRWCAA